MRTTVAIAAALTLVAVFAPPALANVDRLVRNTEIELRSRPGTSGGGIRVEAYLTSDARRDPRAPFKYTLYGNEAAIAILDDGDGTDDTKRGRIEGEGNDPGDNCNYHKVGTRGGLVGSTKHTVVRCKRLTSVTFPGADGHDNVGFSLQDDAPRLTVALLGGLGNDVLSASSRMSGSIKGGDGDDTFAIGSDGPPVDWTVDLGTSATSGAGDNVSIGEFEHFSGGYAEPELERFLSPSYRVAGTNGPNRISTVGGDDEIVAGGGNDRIDAAGFFYDGDPTDRNDIDAGPGDDDVSGGYGADVIVGDTGRDTIDTLGGADQVDAGPGDDVVSIGQQVLADADGDDVHDQAAADVTVLGGEGDDRLGPSVFVRADRPVGRLTLDGGPGKDHLTGAHAGDTLRGGDGDDTIKGGAGDDTIRGGPGDDVIDCGPGTQDVVLDAAEGDTLTNCEGTLEVLLKGTDAGTSDILVVEMLVVNAGKERISDLTAKGGSGLVQVPGVFPAAERGVIVPYFDSGESLPAALEPGETYRRTFAFLTDDPGKVLLQAEVSGRREGETLRDAEYADISVEVAKDRPTDVFEQMGAIEAYATAAHNRVIASSRAWAAKRTKAMLKALPAAVRRRWLGTTRGAPKVRNVDEAMAHLHGISPEELATQVPRGDVVRRGGRRRISAARRALLNAESDRARDRARVRYRKVVRRETLTSSESMAAYNRARMETDRNELYKIYEDMAEKPAKALWRSGGAMFEWLLMSGSYEGRQQMEADLVAFAELNSQSFGEGWWVWSNPGEAYGLATSQFEETIAEAETRRVRREKLKRDLYVTDPERAIYLAAEDDSWYSAQVLRGFMEALAPTPAAKVLDAPVTWRGKAVTSPAARASVVAAQAVRRGDAAAGRSFFNGDEDLGEGVRHADDFTFPSADPDELLRLDQLGKQGGAGMRDQRIAEQINREVTDQLRREFPNAGVEFHMFYRPKKAYDPVGSLAKPQAFSEKSLDPRSIEVLGAPPEGLGRLVIFRPDHPSKVAGWKQLSAAEKRADLELYDLHLDQWTNFHKRRPSGKTADWKPALTKRTTIEFGGGHSVELRLEKRALGKHAFEIRATEMVIDGTRIYKSRRGASIGGDLDPLIAVDAKGGAKLTGEIERRALQLWNEKAVKAQKELGFRSGGHGATAHGDDVTPEQWAKFAKYAAVHMTPEEQLKFEALIVARAGLPPGTKILPAGLVTNEHLVRTTLSDTWVGPLGTVLD